MFVSLRRLAIGAAFLLAVGVRQSEADDGALRSAVTTLFDQSWERTSDGLTKALEQHRRAKYLSPGDHRADYAIALVQWKYLRFDDAERTLRDLTTADPNDWYAMRARIYLSVLMKKYSQALVDIDQLSRRVAEAEADASKADRRRDISQFLGQVFGYLEGPAQRLVSQTSVADARKAVMERLGTQDRAAFSEAFGALGERFGQLDEEKRRLQVETKEADARAKEEELKRLAAEKQGVDADKELIRRQADEALRAAQESVGKIDAQLVPLDAEIVRLNTRGNIVRAEIARLDGIAASLLAQADTTEDPVLEGSLRQQASFAIAQLRRFEIEFRALDAQAVQINAQRSALNTQKAQIIGRYEATAKQLGVEAAKLGRVEKRIAVQETKNRKPATGVSPQVQSLATTAASITSYVEFPLDRERQRILDSFGK